MSAKTWFYSTIDNILYKGGISDRVRNWKLRSANIDIKGVDDLNIIIGKVANAAVSGKLVELDKDGGIIDGAVIPEGVTDPNTIDKDYKPLFRLHNTQLLRDGVSYLFFMTGEYHVLQTDCCTIQYNSINELKLESFTDLYKSFTYTTGGKDVDILAAVKEGVATLTPIFDLGQDKKDYSVLTRGEQIADILKLDDKAARAAQKSFDRLAMLFLSPKSTEVIRQISDKRDDEKRKEKEEFQQEHSLDNGSASVLTRPYEVLNTNPDNRKLDAVAHMNFASERICNHYEYPYKLFRGDTKYDDLKAFIPLLYIGMQPRSDEYWKAICEGLKIDKTIRMDYSDIMEKSIASYVQDDQQADTTSTDEGAGGETQEGDD